MVKIRLSRFGKKNDHFFRVVAISSEKKNKGKALAILGHWNPSKKEIKLQKDEIAAWILKGAQISPTVSKLLQTK